MSEAFREAVADAANAYLIAALGGVQEDAKYVSPYYRQTLRPGDGWVSLGGWERDESGFSFMDTWELRVVLPQNLRDAEIWIDTHGEPLVNALKPHLTILALTPVTLVMDTGQVPGLVIQGVRPHPEGDTPT